MKNKLILIFCLWYCISVAQIKESIIHDNYNRSWLTYLPKNYSSVNVYPLVIALHGGGGKARQLMNNTRKRFNELADLENFIVVYPQGIKKSWNDNSDRDQNGFARKENIDDIGFISKMISQLKIDHNINPNAIFVCGISNGGLMSQTLAMELPNTFKAVGLVASNFGRNQIDDFSDVSPFSILFIHGQNDPVFPYGEGEIGLFGKSRGRVLGISKSVEYMCHLNGNSKEPSILKIENIANDNCTSEHLIYPNSVDPTLKVELINVKGGGHTWPGAKVQRLIKKIVGETSQDFSACDKLWEFFNSTMN